MDNRAHGLAAFSRYYYIGEKYQKKMVIKFCLLAAAGSALFCLLFYWALDLRPIGSYDEALEGMRFIKHTLMRSAVYIDLIVICVLAVAVIILTLLMSHRIAGPMWRMEQSAKSVGSGDLTLNVKLREKDEMKPLADKMNSMVAGLRGRVDEITQDLGHLEVEISMLKDRWAANNLSPEETIEISTDICKRSGALLNRLKSIKTGQTD